VDGFYSVTRGGGVINVNRSDSGYLSIEDSSFRNGNKNGIGAVVSIVVPNSALTIQNSTIQNIFNSNSGSIVNIQSQQNAYLQ
jgi:hypothetical protein